MKKHLGKIILISINILIGLLVIREHNFRKTHAYSIVCSPDGRYSVRDKTGRLYPGSPILDSYEQALDYQRRSKEYDQRLPVVYEKIDWKDCE